MKMKWILSLALLGLSGAVYAQKGTFKPDSFLTPATDLYKGLPEKKDFDMGKLDEDFKRWFEEAKDLCSSDAIKDRKYTDISFYARRMKYYAGHPYFEEATGIKASWVATVSKALYFLATQKVEYERAKDFREKEAPPYLANLLKGRADLYEFMKKPEKVEKEDANNASRTRPAANTARPAARTPPAAVQNPKKN